MKWKDLKLGAKLGIGFGALIVIAVSLGMLAVVNMSSVSTKSKHLAQEYVPEVDVANNVERYSLLTMYGVRGYAFTEEEHFLKDGEENLKKVEEYLAKARELAAKSTQLVKLKGAVDDVEADVNKYKDLLKQTVEANKGLEAQREKMNQNAALFMKNCYDFLADQNQSMTEEIRAKSNNLNERFAKITYINDIIDAGNIVRVGNFKAQAMRDPKSFKEAMEAFNVDKLIEDTKKLTRKQINLDQLSLIKKAADNYSEAMTSFIENWEKREKLNDERTQAGVQVLQKAQEVAMAGIGQTNEIAGEAMNLLSTSSNVMLGGLFFAFLLGIILAVVITRAITVPINKGVRFAQTVANGDLTAIVDVDQKDEIGNLANALKAMVQKLRGIVVNIRSGADNIAAASMQMSSSSQEMSQGATEQASSAEEVSSSMEEMVSNIQQNTDNAQQTEKIAIKAAEGIREGNKSTEVSVSAMKEIASKINIINDIAFQTNILALNAAVEAARAGEHGKGFAVVAAEVRKLAERSKVAADEIDLLSKNGVAVAEKAGTQLYEIVPEIERTAKLVQEIAAASIEQNSGADQVNGAIQQLNQVTQQNAAAAEEMATSSEELSSQAEQLKELISFFKIGEEATRSFSSHSSHTAKTKVAHLENKKQKSGLKEFVATPKKQAVKHEKHDGVVIDLDGKAAADADYENF